MKRTVAVWTVARIAPQADKKVSPKVSPTTKGLQPLKPQAFSAKQVNFSRGDKTAIELFRCGVPALFEQLPNALQGLTA